MSTLRTIKMPKNTGSLGVSRIKRAVQNAYRYNTCHILYDSKTKDWIVKSVRQTIGRKTFKTKAAAIGYAEKIEKRHNCDIIIHGKAGNIQKSARHGIK